MTKVKAPSLVETIKQIAQNAVASGKPANWIYGTVTSVSPLKIRIQPTIELTESFLELSHMVKDYFVDLTVGFETEKDKFLVPDHTHPFEDTQPNGQPKPSTTQPTIDFDTTHHHEIKKTIKVQVHNGLKVGERVILLQMAGGKRYYVLDRVDDHTCGGQWL
ncbi:MAG: DUF2577 domain-containing protein [Alphaproteobacteria bacterium]|nr:DUF2577 domain-containing protein [Alphaproteobacteria bacterium]